MLNSQRVVVDRLLILAEVAKHGSMTAAAEALTYTPSAISQQVRKLEEELGQQLLERHPRGIRFTEAGMAVVEHAQIIQRQVDALLVRLSDLAGLRAGHLRLGIFPTVGASLIPLAISALREQLPAITLSVRSAVRSELLELLFSRAIDAAVLWDYEWDRIDETDLSVLELVSEPTRLIMSSAHPLAGRRSLRLADFRDDDWIVRANGHPVVEVVYRSAARARFRPNVVYEAHDYQETQAMVAVGLGVALAPSLALTTVRDDVTVADLGVELPDRRITLARLSRRPSEPIDPVLDEVMLDAAERLRSTVAGPSKAAAAKWRG